MVCFTDHQNLALCK